MKPSFNYVLAKFSKRTKIKYLNHFQVFYLTLFSVVASGKFSFLFFTFTQAFGTQVRIGLGCTLYVLLTQLCNLTSIKHRQVVTATELSLYVTIISQYQ